MVDNKDLNGYPSPLATNTEKADPSYGLRYFKQMYADWESGKYIDSNAWRKKVEKNRAYADGTQDTSVYKSLLKSGDKSYTNLDWTPVPIVAKFVDVIVNGMVNQEYNLKATTIDPTALAEKDAVRKRKLGTLAMKDTAEEVSLQTGVNFMETDNIPDTPEEIDIDMKLNYKQSVEVAMELGLEFTFDLNDYPEVRKAVYRDLTVISKGAVRAGFSPLKGPTLRYVDPLNLITSYSNSPDYKNISHAGEVYTMTIADIRTSAGNQFTEKQLVDIANNYVGKLGNASTFNSTVRYSNGTSYYEYDKFAVHVLDGEFITDYSIKAEKKENKHGGFSVNRKKDDYKAPKKSKYKREDISTSVKTKYEGKYIVGTDYIFDYKMVTDIARSKENLSEVSLSYKIYEINVNKMKSRSMVDRMIPFADQIQLSHLKLQQALAKARPKGAAFELGALENTGKGDGGDTFTPLDIQDIYDQTGNIYYRRLDDDGAATSYMPIQELENGIGSNVNSFIAIYQHNLQMIRDVTGVNEARDATQPSSEALVGVQKLALLASNNSTRGINNGFLNITKRVAEEFSLRIQDLKDYPDLHKIYSRILGTSSMNAVDMMKKLSLRVFGISIEVAPSEEEKALVEQNIQVSIANGELRLEDAIAVRGISNTKLANQLLLVRRDKYRKEKMEEAQKQMQQNAMTQQQSAAQASQLRQQEMQVEAQQIQLKAEAEAMAKSSVLEAEYKLKEEFERAQHLRRLEEIYAQNEGKVGAANAQKEGRKEIQQLSAKSQSHMIEQRKDNAAPIE